MHILDDQRERALAQIGFARLTYRACRRVSPKCFVIGASVIITRQSKSRRCPQDQKRRGEQQPSRPPCRSRTEPAVRRIAEKFRRVERRYVIAKEIMRTLECRPGGINNESAEP